MPRPSVETLKKVPLFAELESRDLERIADSFKERKYSAGDTIAGEGQGGAGFFVIAEGTARVTVHGDDRGTLGPGNYFGEIALIDEGARTATVTAETDMTCYAMTFWEFRPIVETDARIAWKLVQALAHKLREAEARRLSVDSTLSLGPARRGLPAPEPGLRRARPSRHRESLASTMPPKTTQRVPAERRTTSPGAFPSAVVASTRPSPVTTRS